MLSRIWSHASHAKVVAYLALFVALGGTGAYAANEWTGENIVDGSIRSADVRNEDLTGADILDNSLRGSEIKNGYVEGVDVKDNSLKGADVDESTLSGLEVRAYGRILSNGATTLDKGVQGHASNPSVGAYCLTIPGANPDLHPMIVGADRSNNSTLQNVERVSVAEWLSLGGDCPNGQYEVVTYVYHGDSVDDTDEATDQPGDDLQLANQGFTFVVP